MKYQTLKWSVATPLDKDIYVLRIIKMTWEENFIGERDYFHTYFLSVKGEWVEYEPYQQLPIGEPDGMPFVDGIEVKQHGSPGVDDILDYLETLIDGAWKSAKYEAYFDQRVITGDDGGTGDMR